MTDPSNLPRLYGEKEIGQILKRATELQHKDPPASSTGSMTLQELESIASEVGIDPTYLRRAAQEVDAGPAQMSRWEKAAGEEIHLVREVTVPGELPEDGFGRVVGVMQRGTSDHGQASRLGRTITWHAETSNKYRKIRLSVASHDGHTIVRLEEDLNKIASEIFGVSVGALGGTVGTIAGVNFISGGLLLAGVLVPVGIVGLTYLGARTAYRAIVRDRRDAMGNVFEQVLAEVRACVVERALPPGDEPQERTAG